MPTARQRLITGAYVEAQQNWSKHASCSTCHGQINLVVNCTEGKLLAMTLESTSEAFRAMESAKTAKEKVRD